jgi:hypothetical protein
VERQPNQAVLLLQPPPLRYRLAGRHHQRGAAAVQNCDQVRVWLLPGGDELSQRLKQLQHHGKRLTGVRHAVLIGRVRRF